MPAEKPLLHQDEFGVYRIGSTRVLLDSVLAAFHQGRWPETIRQQYPALALEQVYAALAEYLGNRERFDACLRRQQQVWQDARKLAEQRPCAVVERLRKAGSVEQT